MVQWFPQAQFAGYIVAHEKGFYDEAGIDATILFSDGTDSPLQEVLDKRIEFCTGWLSQTIKIRSENKPIINICQILQKSSLMLVAKKRAGLKLQRILRIKSSVIGAGISRSNPLHSSRNKTFNRR